MSLETWNAISEIAQGFGIAGGAVIGGAWTYHLFRRQRENFPRAELEHDVAVVPLGSGKTLVRLGVIIRNVGRILMVVDEGSARVQQILPYDGKELAGLLDGSPSNYPELDWQELDTKRRANWEIELEPGECEEVHFDFVIDDFVQAVTVYSHFVNREKHGREKAIGWSKTTLHSLCNSAGQRNANPG